jgi:arginine decarboxylase
MTEVLRYVEYDPDALAESVRRQAEQALRAGRITLPQMKLLMEHYEQSLRSYTYLSNDDA